MKRSTPSGVFSRKLTATGERFNCNSAVNSVSSEAQFGISVSPIASHKYTFPAPRKRSGGGHSRESAFFQAFLLFSLAFAARGRYSSPGKLTGPEAGNCL